MVGPEATELEPLGVAGFAIHDAEGDAEGDADGLISAPLPVVVDGAESMERVRR